MTTEVMMNEESIIWITSDINSGTLDVFAQRIGVDDQTRLVNVLNTSTMKRYMTEIPGTLDDREPEIKRLNYFE